MNRQFAAYSAFWFLGVGAIGGAFVAEGVARSLLIIGGNLALVLSFVVYAHSDASPLPRKRGGRSKLFVLVPGVVAAVVIVWSGMLEYAAARYIGAVIVLLLGFVSWRMERVKWKQA